MKNLVLIVHANLQQDLADKLREIKPVSGFTFSHVEGHGSQSEQDEFLSARDKVVGFVPRVRVDILLEEVQVDIVLDALEAKVAGIQGHTVYWVTDVTQHGRM